MVAFRLIIPLTIKREVDWIGFRLSEGDSHHRNTTTTTLKVIYISLCLLFYSVMVLDASYFKNINSIPFLPFLEHLELYPDVLL